MLTYIDASGNLVKTVPEKIYQGSNLANTIYLVGAYPQASVVTIAFKLPQTGLYTEPYIMLNANIPTQIGLNAWSFDVPLAITEYYGKVEFQVKVLGGQKTIFVNGVETTVSQTIASAYGTFEVEKGVPVVLPDTPSQTIYDQILDLISLIQADINNHQLVGMGILPWNNDFNYPIDTLIYYGDNLYQCINVDENGNCVDKNPEEETYYWKKWDLDAITDLLSRVETLETTVSGFDGRITQAEADAAEAKTNANSALTKVGRINVQDNNDGTFTFTNGENQQTTIQSGYRPDNTTIQLDENDKLKAIAIRDGNGIITPSDVRGKLDKEAISTNYKADLALTTDNFNVIFEDRVDPLNRNRDIFRVKKDGIQLTHNDEAVRPKVNTIEQMAYLSDLTGKQDKTDNLLETTNKTVVGAINEVNSVAKGRVYAKSYDSISAMVAALNAMSATDLKTGDNIYIVTEDVPDLWVGKVESTSTTYTYTTDSAFVSALTGSLSTTVQVGYYRLLKLESEKVDLSNVVDSNSTVTDSGEGNVVTGLSIDDSGNVILTKGITALTEHQDISGKANKTITAPDYDNTATYSVGDVVIYNQTLYKCATAVSTAEDFDSTKWTAIDVIEYIDDATSKEEIIKKLPAFKSTIQLSISSTSTAYTFPIVSSTNFAVDWGDGTFEFFNTATTSLTHTFATSGTIYVQFYGNWNGIRYTSSSNTSKSLIYRVWYDKNITNIPEYSFYYCNNLEYFDYAANNLTIGNQSFYVESNMISGYGVKTFDFSRVSSIGQRAFYNCRRLYYPERILGTLNNESFRYSGIYEVNISTNTRTAFQNCLYLKKVVIEPVVITIGSNAFSNSAVKTIISKSTTPHTLSGSLGVNISDFVVLVPYSALNSYKTATNWSTYANQIYPIGGQYSETVTIPSSAWTLNSTTNLYEATATVVGATNESRNILDWSLVDSNGNQIEDTYGLGAKTQASRSITFTAQTAPTDSINIFVQSTLTNYEE